MPTCIYCGMSLAQGEGEERHAGECPVMLKDYQPDIDLSGVKMDVKHCEGCYNNFYNGNNPYGVKQCSMLKTAKLVSRIRVGNFEDPQYYKGKKAVRVPDCYRTGSCGDKFLDPSRAK